MTNLIALALIAAVATLAVRHARARWSATSSNDTLVQLWRRAWPSTRLSWGQLERRVLGRMLASVTSGVGGRVLVPSHFTVHLSERDLETIGDALPVVADGLVAEVARRAADKGWLLLVDPVAVDILCDPDAYDGAPRVVASFTEAPTPTGSIDAARTQAAAAPQPSLPLTEVMPTRLAGPHLRTLPLVSNEVTFDDGHAVPLPPTSGRITLGRGDGVDIRVPQDAVSGRHAAFVRAGTSWKVLDLGSTNGTYLNGARVMPGEESAALLRHGDTVRFGRRGPTCRFTRLAPDTVARPA